MEEEDEDSLEAMKSANMVRHTRHATTESTGWNGQMCGVRGRPGSASGYLQAAEDSKQVVEGHHVAVDRHQTEQPGGADEQ